MNAVLPRRFFNRVGAKELQDQRYTRLSQTYRASLERLAAAFEADHDLQRDLLQDIHLALWRSLARFDDRCSERTWVFRVAHNVAGSHILRHKRWGMRHMTTLEDLANLPDSSQPDPEILASERQASEHLAEFIQALKPPDRQLVVLYLEGLDTASIAEICGLSPSAVSTKVHRLKMALAHRFQHQHGRGK